jgi:chromosomal replication initiation ATPase DnaA
MSETQLALDLAPEAALGAEDFLPAPSNQEALAWLARWPDWGAPGLVLVGPEGSGKSHLARIFASRTGALEVQGPAWPETVPTSVVIDPADPVLDETRLLTWYRAAREQGGHLLLTAERPPSQWPIQLPDLASRLRALPVARLRPPDDALLGALLVKLFRDRGLDVGEGVVAYLVCHMERTFRAAKLVVAELDALSLEQRRPITIPLARAVLGDPTTME